jgi:hypothetical protein
MSPRDLSDPPGPGRLARGIARLRDPDESLPILLALVVASQLVLPAMAGDGRLDGVVRDALATVVLLSGLAAVWGERRWVVRTLVGLVAVGLPVRWAARLDLVRDVEPVRSATTLVALAVLTALVLSKVVRPGMVTRHRIQGAIAAYLLLGLTWASAYEWIAAVDPAAFAGAMTAAPSGALWDYYSLVTLTTMGYGDVTPVSPAARSLAVAEALTGQLYLAILVARLVALELQAREGDPATPGGSR